MTTLSGMTDMFGLDTIQQQQLVKILTYLEQQSDAGATTFPTIPYDMFFGFDPHEAHSLIEALEYHWNNAGAAPPGYTLSLGFADNGGVLEPLADAVTQGRGVSLSAFSAAKYAIQQDAADVNILVVGDSTGDSTTEWVYLFADWLADQYPTHSVSYRAWTDGSNTYAAETVLGVGSGSHTIRFWNASVVGTTPRYMTGAKFAPAIGNLSAVDVVLWNHGHNVATYATASMRGDFLGLMEMIRQAWPSAAHGMMIQNAHRDDTNIEAAVDPVIRAICSDRGDTRFLDVCGQFTAAGKPAGYYTDNLHPNATGQAVWVDYLSARWRASAPSPHSALAAWLDTQTANLIDNGDFTAWSGAVPDGWTASNSPTASKDATEVDGASAYSAKIVGTTAAASIVKGVSAGTATALRGRQVTLAVRQKIPSGSASTCGRIGISYTGGSITSVGHTAGHGGWRWLIMSGVDIPADTTFVNVHLYCDTAANASSAAYYDRAILVEGDIPRDMA